MYISNLFKAQVSLIKKEVIPALWARTITTGRPVLCEAEENSEIEEPKKEERVIHPLETCLRYMESEAYAETYGDKPVWHTYVRNFKGGFPGKTRRSCWSFGKLNRASPCPICRDEYLLPHYRNVKLLKQFISPYGGEFLSYMKTGVCRKQHFLLQAAVIKAQNYGLITFTVPHRSYDYSLYNKK